MSLISVMRERKYAMDDSLISIVMPVHNAEKYVRQSVASVKRQSYQNWELILVEDASTDRTPEILERLAGRDSRIRLIKNEGDHGASYARNAGIAAARGRYLAYLDADDIWSRHKLEEQLAFMKAKKAAFSFTAYEFGDADAKGTGKVVRVPEKLDYKRALSRTVIFTSTVMFDLAHVGKELIYMPHIKSEDTASWWKVLKSGVTAYGINKVYVVYRITGSSLSSDKIEALRRIWNLYRKSEHLSLAYSCVLFTGWAFRAVVRRL